jgi:hypothetical protein
MRAAASGFIGCPPGQVGIAGEKTLAHGFTWMARCGSKTMSCSSQAITGHVDNPRCAEVQKGQ